MRTHTYERGIAPIVAIIIALLVIGAGVALLKKERVNDDADGAPAEGAAGAVHIKLDEQNALGIRGEATLIAVGTTTRVILTTTGKPSETPQPAHIHEGSCPTPGAVKYPLADVGNGASQTLIPVPLETLLAELPLAVNVHKSAAEASVYVACGNIEAERVSKGDAAGTDKDKGEGGKMMDDGEEAMMDKGEEMMEEGMMKKETTVRYTAAGFSPATVEISAGESVTFVNDAVIGMWVASDVHPTHTIYPEFDQRAAVGKGGTYIFTFTKKGTWKYHNHQGPGRTGTVVVN